MAEMKVVETADGPVSIPAQTDELLWEVAAAFAGVPLATLLADTAPVKAAHYEAALRVDHVFDKWLKRMDDEGAAVKAATDVDPFGRLMLAAESLGELASGRRDAGNASLAAVYSDFAAQVLRAAATVQVGSGWKVEDL